MIDRVRLQTGDPRFFLAQLKKKEDKGTKRASGAVYVTLPASGADDETILEET